MLKVSRSGYYRYLSAPKSNRCLENEWLSEIIKKEFHALKGIYGGSAHQNIDRAKIR